MAKSKDEDTDSQEPVGGFAFFLSLAVLIPVGVSSFSLAIGTWKPSFLPAVASFCAGVFGGAFIAYTMIRGPLHVFIHELKHSIVSNLVGNKSKGIKYGDEAGAFRYSYTKRTSHFNAFISLAPYCLPIATLILFVAGETLARSDHRIAAFIVGIGYGIDIILNTRDISPIQTDITLIRGGYHVGLAYITAWNMAFLGVLISWVFQGLEGIKLLFSEFAAMLMSIHQQSFQSPAAPTPISPKRPLR